VLLSARLLDGLARAWGLPAVTPVAVVAALFLPFVGPLGLGLLLRSVAGRSRAAVAGPPPVITRMPELPAASSAPPAEAAAAGAVVAIAVAGDDAKPNIGAAAADVGGAGVPADSAALPTHLGPGALAARLRFARDARARVRAVLATRRLEGVRATPLLRQALRDGHEDVRLLAYALLEDRERQGDALIRRLLAALAAAPEALRAGVHEQLANAYWELCYQQLVAGELESFALSRALEHLDAAGTAAGVRASARWLLRARVLLRQGNAVAARAALEESRRRGMPARTIDPYMVETFFVERSVATGGAPS
jgi:hypothetical protein